ncbi:MAG: 30S ribosomal protein S27e [Nanoarchaeota archaeon]|nr:30S ribosomal protein S27e [Nanoarchaeota archaeon]MBU1644063.1 30S ribosomal protein S27e [Nanoarchaeota archaeon]MBU1977305.1 30S ribosomal protein S27e [Nanoarchaeota archaeon]
MKLETKSKFIKVRCSKCKNEQVVFSNACKAVHCLVCNTEMTFPTGGKAKISARVLEVLE